MTKFKFRVWDTQAKEMMYQPLADLEDLYLSLIDGKIYENCRGNDENLRSTENRFLLMQFTGLRDCHGKEIYEGDICEYHYIDRHKIEFNGIANIFWDEDNCGFALRVIKDSRGDTRSKMSLYTVNTGQLKLKATGNKYENPELLEVSND